MTAYSLETHCPDCFQPKRLNSVCDACGFDFTQYSDNNKSLPSFTELVPGLWLGRTLGEGGFGIVYCGFSTHLGELAVKEFFPERIQLAHRTRDGRFVNALTDRKNDFNFWRERFKQECHLLWKFRDVSTIIKPAREPIEANGTYYLVMERLRGCQLQQFLKLRQGKEGKALPFVEALAFYKALLQTIKKLHDHVPPVFHRDVSGGNIYLVDGRLEKFKLLDFGLARSGDALLSITKSTVAGTPEYASPEQLSGDNVGAYTDIFSAAAVMYTALYGQNPPSALQRLHNDVLQFPQRSDVPGSFVKTLQACLELNPTHRPQSIQSVLDAIDETETPLPDYSYGGTIISNPKPRSPAKNTVQRIALASAFVIGCALLIVGAGWFVFSPEKNKIHIGAETVEASDATLSQTGPRVDPALQSLATIAQESRETQESRIELESKKNRHLPKLATPDGRTFPNNSALEMQANATTRNTHSLTQLAANSQQASMKSDQPKGTMPPVHITASAQGINVPQPEKVARILPVAPTITDSPGEVPERKSSITDFIFGRPVANPPVYSKPGDVKPRNLEEFLFGRRPEPTPPVSDTAQQPLDIGIYLFGTDSNSDEKTEGKLAGNSSIYSRNWIKDTRIGLEVKNVSETDAKKHGMDDTDGAYVIQSFGAARLAGIKAGDVILQWGKAEVKNVDNLFRALNRQEALITYSVLLRRANTNILLAFRSK